MRPVADRGERTSLMEPLMLSAGAPHRGALADLAIELSQRSAGFRRSLPPGLVGSLASLVRSMNCYYSNLIEGHSTHPVDIEKALANDYSRDDRKRSLQREAAAHIAVQAWIDAGGVAGRAYAAESLREIHHRFCAELPEELLVVPDEDGGPPAHVRPGELRVRDVVVGQHRAVSPGAVPRFLARFEQIYASLGKAEAILSAAAAHHRLLWIHPFLDGNGRVARLMSHAALLDLLDTGAVWSVARGLARNAVEYKQRLASCDRTRRNDLDGRGTLSEEALAEFTEYFLKLCIDQVELMEGLVQPDRLRARATLWAEEEIRVGNLPPGADLLVDAALLRGELGRGDAAGILGASGRHARRITAALLAIGALTSDGPRAPLRVAFPARLASRWMPGLFPEPPA